MIIWKSKETRETIADFPHLGRRNWRWILDVNFFAIELALQVMFGDMVFPNWGLANSYYSITLRKRFSLGYSNMTSIKYEGIHHEFALGFLHFNWNCGEK